MKPIVFALALAGATGVAAQQPVALGSESLTMSYAPAQYAGAAAGRTSGQYGTYPEEFSDIRAGISREMAASLNGLLEDRLASELDKRSSSQTQLSAES